METHDLVSFKEAAAHLPGRPSLATLHRWRLNGVGGVKLETVKVGGRRFVSRQALQRFIDDLTAAQDNAASDAAPKLALSYKSQAAAEFCEAEGL